MRTASVYCDTSRFWFISDLVIAGASLYVSTGGAGSVGTDSLTVHVPGAVFAASGLYGIYKRHRCVRYRETAPPEVWAAAAEEARRQDEADARARAAWQREQAAAHQAALQEEQAAQQRAAQSSPQPRPISPQPRPIPPSTSRPPPQGSSGQQPTIVIQRHSARDELGKTCRAQAGWPSAAECQHGAVCYANRCTVWCSNDGSCPSGYTCRFTDEQPMTKLCRPGG